MGHPDREGQERKPREVKPLDFLGLICWMLSMVIIWIVWPGLPDWEPPVLSMVIGYACWLAYRSLSRRNGKPRS
jgi:hypothetical protein